MSEIVAKSDAASSLPEADWTEVAVAQVPEYLLDLRTSARGISAMRKHDGRRFSVRMTRLTHDLVEMAVQPVPAGGHAYLSRDETIWCFVYTREYALAFILRIEDVQGDSFQSAYPTGMWIRKERRHKRFIPRVPMQCTWQRPGTSEITGDVMDIGLGGFLGGVNVVAHSDLASAPQEGDRGSVSLSREDGVVWTGEGVLRRISWVGDPDNGELAAFILLGFAFVFPDERGARQLTEFLDGLLEPM